MKTKCWYCGKGSEAGTLRKIGRLPWKHDECGHEDERLEENLELTADAFELTISDGD